MAETERGLLNADITQIGGTQLSTNLLILLLGGLPLYEDQPVLLELRPEIAPVVTTGPALAGGLGDFYLSGYRVKVFASDVDQLLAEFVIDFHSAAGLDFIGGELAFTLTAPTPDALDVTVVQNVLGVPDSRIEPFVETAAPLVFQAVSDQLPAFPVPKLGGATIDFVEIGRHGTGYVLYGNLVVQ